ncbi:hypothetical protein INR49_024741 [Caranx melampygus]|nr:hypothetical protein INR49_024741 [Caranx melampygus]
MENLNVYHGPIGKEEGERRLAQDGRDGCYLVRNSDSVPGVFCLCTSPGVQKRYFRQIRNLIAAFQKPDQGIAMPLLYPVTAQRRAQTHTEAQTPSNSLSPTHSSPNAYFHLQQPPRAAQGQKNRKKKETQAGSSSRRNPEPVLRSAAAASPPRSTPCSLRPLNPPFSSPSPTPPPPLSSSPPPSPCPLLLLVSAVAHAQAQRPLLESDISKSSSPAAHSGAHLRHAHVHTALQDTAPDAQPQGEVFFDWPGLEEVVGVAAVHSEAQPTQVDGPIQNGCHATAVLAGYADDFALTRPWETAKRMLGPRREGLEPKGGGRVGLWQVDPTGSETRGNLSREMKLLNCLRSSHWIPKTT